MKKFTLHAYILLWGLIFMSILFLAQEYMMWPISQRVNGDETMSFEEAVSRLKQAYLDKLDWLNQHIGNK